MNDTSSIGMVTSEPKDVSVNYLEQCLHIITHKDRSNVLKISTKCKIDNPYLNLNHVSTMFKLMMMLRTEE